ncbi:conserved hypothetical protein [Bradyrhizobium sp. ORS 375]|uniref:hypothetical protein n=1 Tax=Bradyrhizobium sp. (strain ORS 375) TaxID=566679 RepID=UPI000240577D|nr:hypothetical protein [Bradyrhizobium sp. ORS 375]CCD90615.1 conserved hypothetical protein [Bradyrhizobium sp. ORS 375]
MGEPLANIIKFPTAATRMARSEQADLAFDMAVAIQLVQLKRTLDAWRMILHRLDELAQAEGRAVPCAQSHPIRQLIADAERAIAEVRDRAGVTAPADDHGPREH